MELRILAATIALLAASPAVAEPSLPDGLAESMDALSRSLTAKGEGPAAYAALLHPDYARWAMGESYQRREAFLEGLQEWWDYGMRVNERRVEIAGADLYDDIAIVRVNTSESFVDLEGATSGFDGYVVSVWKHEGGRWLLLSADIAQKRAAE